MIGIGRKSCMQREDKHSNFWNQRSFVWFLFSLKCIYSTPSRRLRHPRFVQWLLWYSLELIFASSLLMLGTEYAGLFSQYPACWCSGSLGRQGITQQTCYQYRIGNVQGRIQDLKLGVAQDLKVRGGANGLENLKTTGGGGGEYCINSFCSIYTYIYIANKI